MFDSTPLSTPLAANGSAELGVAASVSAPNPITAAAASQYGFIMDSYGAKEATSEGKRQG
jgi:hypothetical protein